MPQCGNVSVTATVTNSGEAAGSEVAQIYVTNPTRTMPSQRQNNQQDLDPAQQNFDTVRPRSLRAHTSTHVVVELSLASSSHCFRQY